MSAGSAYRGRRRPGRISGGLLLDVACSLTDRDRQILTLLRRHRVLATSQLHAMFFTDANTARHRLTRLHRLRLVDRFRLPTHVTVELHPREHPARPSTAPAGWIPTTEYGYVLDTVGAQVLAAGHTDPGGRPRRVRWRTDQALAIATSPRLAHTLGTNQLFVDLAAAARHQPGAGLGTWWGEAYCHAQLGGLVNPDGIGLWKEQNRSVAFAVEYDRGTETLARLAGKLADYARLEEASGWAFWLLVTVPGPRRETGARARLGAHGLPVATTSRGLPGGPAGPVWAPVSANPDRQRVRLIDLTGWPRPAASTERIRQARDRQAAPAP